MEELRAFVRRQLSEHPRALADAELEQVADPPDRPLGGPEGRLFGCAASNCGAFRPSPSRPSCRGLVVLEPRGDHVELVEQPLALLIAIGLERGVRAVKP